MACRLSTPSRLVMVLGVGVGVRSLFQDGGDSIVLHGCVMHLPGRYILHLISHDCSCEGYDPIVVVKIFSSLVLFQAVLLRRTILRWPQECPACIALRGPYILPGSVVL